jgi:hypothetical protein
VAEQVWHSRSLHPDNAYNRSFPVIHPLLSESYLAPILAPSPPISTMPGLRRILLASSSLLALQCWGRASLRVHMPVLQRTFQTRTERPNLLFLLKDDRFKFLHLVFGYLCADSGAVSVVTDPIERLFLVSGGVSGQHTFKSSMRTVRHRFKRNRMCFDQDDIPLAAEK